MGVCQANTNKMFPLFKMHTETLNKRRKVKVWSIKTTLALLTMGGRICLAQD